LLQKWYDLVKNNDTLTLPYFFDVILNLIKVSGNFFEIYCDYFLTGCLKIIEVNVNELKISNYSEVNIDKELLIKSIDTIIAMEDAGYSSDDYSMRGNSYARGRGSNARRDSMGRYSSENYSMRGGRSGERSRNYSYDDEINNLREQLEDMEHMAKDEESKRMIRQWKMQLN
jgi:hypothetical protein